MCLTSEYDLIVAVVRRGLGDKAVAKATELGAKGATVISSGRAVGLDEVEHVFGLAMEAERDVLLIAVPVSISAQVADAIEATVNINVPGNGFLIILPVKGGRGLAKLLSV